VALPPDKAKRQSTYIDAISTLADSSIYFGKYQTNPHTCRNCGHVHNANSEKMTDVNIAVELLQDAFQDAFDVAILISADSDLIAPIAAVKKLFPQKRVIVAGVAASPFDPELWLAERQRRQRDTLAILRELLATRADRDQRLAGLRTLALRVERSPDPDYRAYQARLAEYNCGFAARIHTATTPEQRRQARDTLKGWEADLRALTAPPG